MILLKYCLSRLDLESNREMRLSRHYPVYSEHVCNAPGPVIIGLDPIILLLPDRSIKIAVSSTAMTSYFNGNDKSYFLAVPITMPLKLMQNAAHTTNNLKVFVFCRDVHWFVVLVVRDDFYSVKCPLKSFYIT